VGLERPPEGLADRGRPAAAGDAEPERCLAGAERQRIVLEPRDDRCEQHGRRGLRGAPRGAARRLGCERKQPEGAERRE
jgi:hypothetical protein